MEQDDILQETSHPNASTVIEPSDQLLVLPWERRGEIGRFSAYWKTVFHVIRRNGRLGRYMLGPVNYRDAQKFRWITIALAMVPSLFFSIVIAVCGMLDAYVSSDALEMAMLWLVPIFLVLGFVALAFMIGVVSWFFCPRRFDTERQNRSVALSYYTCAPLALMLFVALIMLLALPFVGGDNAEEFVLSDEMTLDQLEIVTEHLGLEGFSRSDDDWRVIKGIGNIQQVGAGIITFYWYQLILFGVGSIARRRIVGIFLTAVLLPVSWLLIWFVLISWLPPSVLMWLLMHASLT